MLTRLIGSRSRFGSWRFNQMAILSSDIKLRASERMTDTSDGGGRRTLNVIEDGVAGNVFPKVSRVDSVYGRVNLRKVYGHVDTDSGETYAGSHFIVTDAPDNDRIHVTAFSTGSDYDNRTAARDRIESYVISGPESRMVMYGRQLLGVQALLVYQREEEPLPEIGEVYVVSNETGGVTVAQQFVAIQDMDHEVRTFTDAGGDFKRRVITLTIGAPLRYEFLGLETPSRLSGSPAGAKFRSTTVADAARYFGIQPLADDAAASDLTVNVDSVYTPIVPTTQRETALSTVSIAGSTYYVAGGSSSIAELIISYPPSVFYFTNPVISASMVSNITGASPIKFERGTSLNAGRVFTLSSDGRVFSYTGSNDFSISAFTVVYGYEVSSHAHTREIEITLGTRGTVYTPVLLPLPAPGTLIVDYRALGKWYRLRDDGLGELSGGDAAYGTGTVNYITGGVIITLGALPDVGSSLLLSWGSPVHYEIKTNDAGNTAKFSMMLPDLPVKRASVVVTYYINAVATTAASNLQGLIAGSNSVTGSIAHLTGELNLEFGGKLPDAGSVISVAYLQLQPTVEGESASVSFSFPALTPTTIPNAPFDPHSVKISIIVAGSYKHYGTVNLSRVVTLVDDGSGNLIIKGGTVVFSQGNSWSTNWVLQDPVTVGTIDYATGLVTIVQTAIPAVGKIYNHYLGGWLDRVVNGYITTADASCNAVVTGVATSDLTKAVTANLDDTPIVIDLLRTTSRSIVVGSVMFTLGGKTYIDRNGTIYTDINPTTGAGLAVGTIDYSTGLVTLTQWTNNTTIALSVKSCLTKYGEWMALDAFFRTVGSPIRPASLYVQVTADDGTLITGLADQNGYITGTYMRGKVEQIMGVVVVEFGQMVTAAGNELEDWYTAGNVVGGMIWQPKAVQPGTLRYSAVVLSNLPLNADILGLDPVRLPSDGRVPIYRSADVVVIHNTQSYNAGTPTASQVVNVGRTDLAALWLEDANKLKLPVTMYAANLDAGTVTMAADLSLTGYVTPISVKHRIEEMGLLSDVQINGQITLTAPLLRDYPLGSFVSSALLFGDMFSRVTGVFDQATWTNVWSNALIGSQATAQYNDVDYPIAVSNTAAVTDRWRISFTSGTAFQVISENLGVITTGTTSVDLAPVNPLTGFPYFTLQWEGWGLSWATGNQLRFNTIGAAAPIWLARTVLPGATLVGDSFDAQLRGDVD
jgi:hypothetical protein